VNAFRVDLQQQLRIDLKVKRTQLSEHLSLDEERSQRKDSNDSSSSSRGACNESDEWVGLEKIRAGEFGANMLNDLKVRRHILQLSILGGRSFSHLNAPLIPKLSTLPSLIVFVKFHFFHYIFFSGALCENVEPFTRAAPNGLWVAHRRHWQCLSTVATSGSSYSRFTSSCSFECWRSCLS
jgi:hypothetical protein